MSAQLESQIDRGQRDRNAPARTRRAWPIVAKREMLVHLTDRNFIVGTLFSLITLLAVLAFQGYMAGRSHHFEVAVSTPQAVSIVERATADPQAKDDRTSLSVVNVNDDAAAL